MPVQLVSLNELENHLWESANILRGPVDAADFKTYIFPLLFFKRIHWLTYSIGSMDGTYIGPAAKPFRRVMAHLLGVRRVGITVAATAMQNSGYVRYNRGEIKLLDRTGLEGRACSCYIRAVTPSQ